jgi:hypothetical protein
MEGRNHTTHRQECLDQSVLLFVLGVFWMATSLIGLTKYTNMAILVFITGNTLIAPFVSFAKKLLQVNHSSSENFSTVLSCLTLGVLMGLLIAFFPFIENPNIFLPSFALIQGVFFAISGQMSGSKSYWSVAIGLIFTAVFCLFNFLHMFSSAGLISSAIFLTASFGLRIIPELSKVNYNSRRGHADIQLGKLKPGLSLNYPAKAGSVSGKR